MLRCGKVEFLPWLFMSHIAAAIPRSFSPPRKRVLAKHDSLSGDRPCRCRPITTSLDARSEHAGEYTQVLRRVQTGAIQAGLLEESKVLLGNNESMLLSNRCLVHHVLQ